MTLTKTKGLKMKVTKQIINGKTFTTQHFAEDGIPAIVAIGKSPAGLVARISYYGNMTRKGVAYVPVELLSLAAGKDAWMREITFKCAACGERHAAKVMSNGYCETCVEKQEQENAALDNNTLSAS